ncbi:MAG: hypothetical protein HFG33_01275 [Bacilli bacterium]|nr:hypothetical protein [Bacilli bacterium]
MEPFYDFMLDMLGKLIIDKAFNKEKSIKERLPYILSYYIVIILLLSLSVFLSVNFIRTKNVLGYFLAFVSIILFIMLILPFFENRNKR